MSSVTLILVVLATVVLLPIVPAYLLFRLLPSSTNVSGPLQGLEIKLGGAFAGYFILVVLILTQLSNIQKVAAQPAIGDQVWSVEGQILDNAGNPIEPLGPTDVELMPRLLDIETNGNFQATFATTLLPAGNGVSFPKINLSHEGYTTLTIPLDPKESVGNGVKLDVLHHRISLPRIRLAKLAQYAGNGASPAPVTNPNYPGRDATHGGKP